MDCARFLRLATKLLLRLRLHDEEDALEACTRMQSDASIYRRVEWTKEQILATFISTFSHAANHEYLLGKTNQKKYENLCETGGSYKILFSCFLHSTLRRSERDEREKKRRKRF